MCEIEPIIDVRGVWKTYGEGDNKVDALQGVSLTIVPRSIIGVMGPSGCGKTTLLNCLSGIDSVSKGKVYLEDRDLHVMEERKRDAYRADNMGFVFQSYNLIPVLSAIENVEIPLLCRGVSTKEARRRAGEALRRVGLSERSYHRPAQLSSGQQQRVALARAIVNNPLVVWADEPTGALDRETTGMVLDLIEHLNRVDGITFVIVTHNPKVAERCHRVLYMDSGKIVMDRALQVMSSLSEGSG